VAVVLRLPSSRKALAGTYPLPKEIWGPGVHRAPAYTTLHPHLPGSLSLYHSVDTTMHSLLSFADYFACVPQSAQKDGTHPEGRESIFPLWWRIKGSA
jgi:hypothetical protein